MPESLVAEAERWLDRLFVAADGATLRREDRRKAVEVAALPGEIEIAANRLSRRSPLILVDTAAGKSYVGLLAAGLVLEPAGRKARVVTIESDPDRVRSSLRAVESPRQQYPHRVPYGRRRRPVGVARASLGGGRICSRDGYTSQPALARPTCSPP